MRKNEHSLAEVWIGRKMTNKDVDRVAKIQRVIAHKLPRLSMQAGNNEPLRFHPKPNGSLTYTSEKAIERMREDAWGDTPLDEMTNNAVITDIVERMPRSADGLVEAQIGHFTIVKGFPGRRLALVFEDSVLDDEVTVAHRHLYNLAMFIPPQDKLKTNFIMGTITGQGMVPEAALDIFDNSAARLGLTALRFHPLNHVLRPAFEQPQQSSTNPHFSASA